ncbi:MAG: cytochrome-c oxidase, cbb3-type subunit III [Pseudomonadota bacterium]
MTVPDDGKVTDALTGTATTQHEWDGIQELDTPLPRWWLYTFYLCIVWGVIYTIFFPAWPLISGATSGVLGFSSRAQVAHSIEAQSEANSHIIERVAAADFAEIADDADMNTFARAGGGAVFRTYCSQCHGAGAAGVVGGYPNLLDDDWLWGGVPDAIAATIRHGIRWEEDEDTRWSAMPAFGQDEILTEEEIEQVAEHVLSFSGTAQPNETGAEIYADNCAGCHGDQGRGDPEQGAPNLADAIWLYGGDKETVIYSIANARYGVMPAWNTRLTESEIRQVTHYVHGLGGGE